MVVGYANPQTHRFPGYNKAQSDCDPQVGMLQSIGRLQQMLIQADKDDRILLFPAWPADFDVEFKVHAQYNTVIEGKYSDGTLESLKVTPSSRKDDVVFINPPFASP
jgi:alpha-L-fucosidase 2